LQDSGDPAAQVLHLLKSFLAQDLPVMAISAAYDNWSNFRFWSSSLMKLRLILHFVSCDSS
jgi:hypothetical protein